jgi:hypothetical protein
MFTDTSGHGKTAVEVYFIYLGNEGITAFLRHAT